MEKIKSINLDKEAMQYARLEANHKQSTLAQTLNVSRRHIIRIENGENVSNELAEKIAIELNVTVKQLEGKEDKNETFTWFTKYPKGTKKLNREQKSGKIGDSTAKIIKGITKDIDELLKNEIYQTGSFEIITRLSLSEDKKSYFLDIESHLEGTEFIMETTRYEIKKFTHNNEVGMIWEVLPSTAQTPLTVFTEIYMSSRVTKHINDINRG